ncbi:MAG: hypothetical protein IKW77_09870 [Salinivirgaceae bacterium]|nr:hypothetical protein [Salinivirgaceae bacterium]
MNLQNVKKALYAILGKDANVEGDVCYWVEASEIIEHLMAKYNANPIPNIYAECLLKQQVVLDNDGVHYTRCIEHQDECRKMVFGFTNKEFYNQIVNEYEDEYTDLKWFMDKIQKNDWNPLYSEDYPANIVKDLGIVNVLANAYEDEMLDCLTANMYDYLVAAKTELEEYQRKKPNPQVENCIDFAELMLELPKLECFEI